ncbi:glycosyltransferase family 39 protein [Gordonia sp. HY366]|uniref:Glycosyltransferase family 39 protein n=1 Tax=Gordonia liuliyuniae TaxID=2911517 RepID=A0ABS9ISM2_9ACTN|nr:glycosyltransferase family 39 protein [Gordonia liuliyuniae]MCF8588543.1 glycosyltransferase family 39 protein [Gordonia liuliyuniae]
MPDSAERPEPSRRATLWSLAVLLVGTAVLYLWNLSANGWANSFYTAAIQAGSQSWKAWFFGSSDMANSITVDKPPASLWIPGIVVRVFGLNSWTVLVPEALMGVASVLLLYVITRRLFGHWAGIGAGAVLALTPVAAMMFRFDNPEALLILLMIAACGALLTAIETGRLRWMIAAGVAIGFGFLAKQLEVMLIVPAMVIVYFVAAPGSWKRRVGHLFAALGSLIVGAGWWVFAVTLWPASSRPYIGGSPNNSILELTLGYNGLGRLSGDEEGSVVPGKGIREQTGRLAEAGFGGGAGGGPGGGGGMWGETGFWRMFDSEQGGQIAWLIPAAVITLVGALVVLGRAPRADGRRAYLLLFAGWLVSMAGTFSYMAGIFHSYYTAALAPAIGAVVAGSVAILWPQREKLWIRAVFAVTTWGTAGWGFTLLARSSEFLPWLRWVVLVGGVVAGALLLVGGVSARQRRLAVGAAAGAILVGLAGPTAYTLDTVATAKDGSIISAGPQTGGPGGPGGHGPGGGHRGGMPGGQMSPGQMPGGGPPGTSGGGPPGTSGGGPPGMSGGGEFGAMGGGGLLSSSEPTEKLTALLREDADDYTWIAAAIGSNEASGYQIATGYSVMPIGGFNGTDPSPTLAEFKQLVVDGKIHYFIGGGGGGFGSREGTASEITDWVESTFTSTTVDGATLYDLSGDTD